MFLKLCKHLSQLISVLIFANCSTNIGTSVADNRSLEPAMIAYRSQPIASDSVDTMLDMQDQKRMRSNPRTLQRMERGDPLTVDDIIKLHQNGVSDEAITDYMQKVKATYSLTQTQIRRLQNNDISDRVISYMTREES